MLRIIPVSFAPSPLPAPPMSPPQDITAKRKTDKIQLIAANFVIDLSIIFLPIKRIIVNGKNKFNEFLYEIKNNN
jgi:hypothetical protein